MSTPAEDPTCSSINTTPPEILGYIFELCLENDVPTPRLPLQTRNVLVRVCARWRAVAISIGRLWSDVDISPDSCARMTPSVVISLLSRQLQWLAECPLCIRFDGQSIGRKVVGCLQLLLTVSHLWSTATLKLDARDAGVLRESTVAFPMLESLDIQTADKLWNDRTFDLTRRCPKLRHVVLSRIDDLGPLGPLLPWAQLASCSISVLMSASALQILKLMPQVNDLSITMTLPPTALNRPPVPIDFPNLTTLNLNYVFFSGREAEWHLMRSIRAPALRHLLYVEQEVGHSVAATVMSRLVQTSGCALTRFDWRGLQLDLDGALSQFTALLALMPSLQHLSLHPLRLAKRGLDDDFFAALTFNERQILPLLESLTVDAVFDCTAGSVATMLRSRNAATGAGKLRCVLFRFDQSSRVTQMATVNERLGLEGLRIEIEKR
ncbi:F-box domain-containing protein [Mycena kentingensis (nom. inval.)]|nr:F-box domain-containing protein [Mycena kentingensis (nom. inval.)]